MKKNINRIAFFNTLSVLLLQGISLISAPLFSRLLGTDGYGNLASFTVWANTMTTVLSLQSNVTIVNARQEFPEEEQPAYQSSVMALSMLCFAAAGIVMMVFSGPLSQALKMNRTLIALMLVYAFGAFCLNFLGSKFTYEFKADKNMLLSVFMAVANLGVSLLLVLNMPQEQRYFGRVLGAVVTSGVVGLIGCIWILCRGKTFYNANYWKFCFMLGWPLACQGLAYSLLSNSDIMMLRQMADASSAGIYSYAMNLATVMFLLYNALNSTWVPFFYDDMKRGMREDVARRGKNYVELYTVLCVGFILLVREVYHIYADESFWSGIEVIPFFVASYFANTLCTFPVNYEMHHKKTGAVTIGTVSAALINVGLNYLMIRVWGMLGAAAATLIARCIQLALHELYSRCILGKGSYPFQLKTGLLATAALAASAVLFYLAPNAWFIRWPLAAAVGVWELMRIVRRKSLL